jgi:hypothetical protein
MAYSKPWQAQIEQGLRSMQAFVAIVHQEFNASAWCQQEVGWALGRRVPKYVIRMGVDPAGFIGSDQWPAAGDSSAKQIATVISSWIATVPDLGDTMVDGLLTALSEAGNYMTAGVTAERIASLETLTEDQFARLAGVWWQNDQLYGGALPTKALQPFYRRNGREWPPPKPVPPNAEPWAAVGSSEEPPF